MAFSPKCRSADYKWTMYDLFRHKSVSTEDFSSLFDFELPKYVYKNYRFPSKSAERIGKLGTDCPYGSVFNVEFTPSGDSVLAVHANKAITVHDPRLEKQVHVVPRAHGNCVNVVSFLDHFAFATGSDDRTVRLWDIRKMSSCTATLHGHKGWVKNAEFDRHSCQLFTIAFEDGVRVWDINDLEKYTSTESSDNLLFRHNNLTRLRISPDRSMMVMCLRMNHLVSISNFDGRRIAEVNDCLDVLPGPDNSAAKERYAERKCNVPSLHVLVHSSKGEMVRSPLSFVFHPCSNLAAMRVVDIMHQAVVMQELTLLYNLAHIGKGGYKPSYPVEDVSSSIVKFREEICNEECMDYIKEINFSPDGRVLASPDKDGVHLLVVDSVYTPMDLFFDDRYHSPDKDMRSLEFEESTIQVPDNILCCKFSACNLLLAAGSLEGRVFFLKPQI